MSRLVNINGVKLTVLSRSEFAKQIGVTSRCFLDWVERGIIPPPTLKDSSNPVRNWNGEDCARKFYLQIEAFAVRAIKRDYVFGQRREIVQEFVDRIQEAIKDIRDKVKRGDISLMRYPLILEFKDFSDFHEWFQKYREVENASEIIYKEGDKLIDGKEYAEKTGKEGKFKEACKK